MGICKCGNTWSYHYVKSTEQRYCTKCGAVQCWNSDMLCWCDIGTL